MYQNHETHVKAEKLADIAAGRLARNNVREAAVVVTIGPWTHHPLAIRTPGHDGFGNGSSYGSEAHRKLLVEAWKQAEYQLQVGNRTAKQQEEKLAGTPSRTAASYSYLLGDNVKSLFAHDAQTNLTLAIVSPEVDDQEARNLAENAITSLYNGQDEKKLLATELIDFCLMEVRRKLPKDRTGFVMVSAPTHTYERNNPLCDIPAIFCSQSGGYKVEPANFGIVAAKARTVAISNKASGSSSSVLWSDISTISGAIPVSIGDHTSERVLAAGGLVDGVDDVAALLVGMKNDMLSLEVRQLEELSDLQYR